MSAAQFDVFPNPDPEFADSHPYFVVLQANALGHLKTRLIAPLIAPKRLALFARLMPEVTVGASRYVIDVTNIGAIPTSLLKSSITNLEEQRYQIIGALDLVFTGI